MVTRFLMCFVLVLFSTLAFAKTIDEQWHIGIGDPTIFGWVTVAFYIFATYFSFKRYQRLKQAEVIAKFWLYLAGLLLLLSVNKQLDLQTLLTQVMREHAFANNWYEQRKTLQTAFIVFLGMSMLIAILSLRVFLSKSWRQYKLAWIGILLLGMFILIRAASFHHFDLLIGTYFLGLRINVILEISALIIIIFAALKHHEIPDTLVEPKNSNANTGILDYVEIQAEEDIVKCPKCTFSPSAKAVDGRLFKCKKCGHKYTLFINPT